MATGSSQKTTTIMMVVLAGLLGYIAYTGSVIDNLGLQGLSARRDRVKEVKDSIATLEAATEKAKRELAHGTVEDLRRRLDVYRGSLALLRRLVPDRNEVPNLLDDITTRGRIRGITLSQVTPQPVEAGPAPFDTHRYTLSAIGHYDQIGAFLADIASLQRIIVPFDLTMAAANVQSAKALGDTTGSMLEAKFQIRTYVKSPNPEGDPSGT